MIVQAEFEFDAGKSAGIIYEALLPELEEDYQRTKATLELKDNLLVLKLEAKDIVSMRAALNGWLRMLKVTSEMCALNAQVIN